MKVCKSFVFSVLFILSCTFFTASANYALYIDRVEQEQSSWCWIASSKMIADYAGTGSVSHTQSEICTYVKGMIVDASGTDDEAVKAIEFASVDTLSAYTSSTYMSFSRIQSEINSRHPIYIHMAWSSNKGHAVVGSGYNSADRSVQIIDPLVRADRILFEPYDRLISNITLQSGTGKWLSTVYIA